MNLLEFLEFEDSNGNIHNNSERKGTSDGRNTTQRRKKISELSSCPQSHEVRSGAAPGISTPSGRSGRELSRASSLAQFSVKMRPPLTRPRSSLEPRMRWPAVLPPRRSSRRPSRWMGALPSLTSPLAVTVLLIEELCERTRGRADSMSAFVSPP